ncbi:MAG TPA: SpoIID/LytB domain-containing protein [Spirochaetia bacterium]|nr:SpoIID/LytB domain-containing protein [Spirochaetia bacterium]
MDGSNMTINSLKHRLRAIFLLPVLLFPLILSAPAAHAQGSIRFVIGARYWYADAQKQTMDVAPEIVQNRTYLPVRYLAQALGIDPSQIFWQPKDNTVTLVSQGTTVKLTIGSNIASVNGSPLTMDVAPLLVPPGRVILPARWLAQSFGWQVDWQSAQQTVSIYPQEVAVAHDAVNVRQASSTTAPVQAVLARGTLLAVTGQADTWLQVSLPGGATGWIAGYLVSKAGVPISPAPSEPSRGQVDPPPQTSTPAPVTTPSPVSTPAPATTASQSSDGSPLIRVSLDQALTQTSFSLNSPGQLLDADSNRVLATLSPGQTYLVGVLPTGLSVSGVTLPATSHDLLVQAPPAISASPFLISLQAGGTAHRYRAGLVLQLAAGRINVSNQLPLEQYLYGVVPKELSPSAPPAALEAQAVAARSYALAHLATTTGQPYALLSSQASQVYGGYDAEYPATDQAVDLTRGVILMAGGQLADAVYAASDGGCTENSEDVWNGTVPYLRGKPDPYDPTGRPAGKWQVTYTAAQLSQQLAAAGYPFTSISNLSISALTAAGHRIKSLTVTGLGTGGQPASVTISNADNVRMALGLASAPFSMTPMFTTASPNPVAGRTGSPTQTAPSSSTTATGKTSTPNPAAPAAPALSAVTFTGGGDGHDVGLSQEGAEAMGGSGHSYQNILNFYYTGVSLVPNYGR